MELTRKQLEYILTCLDFHYTENYDKKEELIIINSSIAKLVKHEIDQYDKLQKKIDRNKSKQPKPEW